MIDIDIEHELYVKHKDLLFSKIDFSYINALSFQQFVAIYIRVSSEKQAQDGTSLKDQIESCLKKVVELEIPIEQVRIYHEGQDTGGGESAGDIDRPEMNRLRSDAENGLIKQVILTHPDRFSRNLNGKLEACSSFSKNDVVLTFVDAEYKNTPEGQLLFNILSVIAEYELEQIKRRTRKGVIRAVKDKKKIQPMRVSPYGYDLIDGKFVVIEEEAKFVQKIYTWYIEDKLTMRQIGEKLYYEGAIPKRKEGEQWNQSTIARILKNENYIGRYYYNKRKTKKVKGERTKNGKVKKTYSIREKEEWILIEDENVVPKLVTFEMFYKAQAKRFENWKEKGQVKHNYLLNKLLQCEECGIKFSPYTSQSQQTSKKTGETKKWYYKRYRCQNKNPRKYGGDITRCSLPVLHADLIEKFIWEQFILNTICNVELLERTILEKENEGFDPKLDELDRLKKKYNELEDEGKRIIKSFQKKWITEDEADKQMEKILTEQSTLKFKIDQIEESTKTKTNIKKTKEDILESAKLISTLVKKNEDLPFELKHKIVNLLIENIIVSHGNKENEINLKVIGVINEEKVYDTINKILSDPCLQPQVIVNKDNVVRKYSKSLLHKDSLQNVAYVEYLAKILYITEKGKDSKLRFRKSKFAIN